MDDNLIG